MITHVMGMQIENRELYAEYRRRMLPLLEAAGGSFGVDVWVSEVLRSPAAASFNRLFTLRFPTVAAREAFFGSAEYAAVKKTYFDPSVSARTVLAQFETSEPSP